MVVFVQMSRIMSGSCAFVTRCRAHVIGLFIHSLPYPSICVTARHSIFSGHIPV